MHSGSDHMLFTSILNYIEGAEDE